MCDGINDERPRICCSGRGLPLLFNTRRVALRPTHGSSQRAPQLPRTLPHIPAVVFVYRGKTHLITRPTACTSSSPNVQRPEARGTRPQFQIQAPEGHTAGTHSLMVLPLPLQCRSVWGNLLTWPAAQRPDAPRFAAPAGVSGSPLPG